MRAMCKKGRGVEGHIIVETALILPLILWLMVWLVFFIIFVLDMSVVKSEAIRVSNETAAVWDRDGDLVTGRFKIPAKGGFLLGQSFAKSRKGLQGRAVSRLKKRIRERTMLTSCRDIKVAIGREKVVVSGTVSFHWPLPANAFVSLHGFKFTGKAASGVNDWEDQLRAAAARNADRGNGKKNY